jgi:hypothetical protein
MACEPCLPPPANDCYPVEHPCTIYAKLENALVARAVGGSTAGYRVGEESFQFSHLSFADLRAMRDEYHGLCSACGGCPPPIKVKRGRARVCFIPGDHRCNICRSNSCGCSR